MLAMYDNLALPYRKAVFMDVLAKAAPGDASGKAITNRFIYFFI